jgi:uncharacterized membrane protein YfcA
METYKCSQNTAQLEEENLIGFEMIVLIVILSIIMEAIDSGLGMMYGTLLSPLLIIFGFSPQLVVPAILVSQATGGIAGTISHHKNKNADFGGLNHHMKIVLVIVLTGIIAVISGVIIASFITEAILKIYIGSIAIIMGILCLLKFSYSFKWWKIAVIGFIASFNKSATGGGFGPLSSTGKILSGVESKVSVATTTFAEVPLCILGFSIYVLLKGLPDISFTLTLMAGTIIGGMFGPVICAKINHKKMRKIVGMLAIISGTLVLIKALLN